MINLIAMWYIDMISNLPNTTDKEEEEDGAVEEKHHEGCLLLVFLLTDVLLTIDLMNYMVNIHLLLMYKWCTNDEVLTTTWNRIQFDEWPNPITDLRLVAVKFYNDQIDQEMFFVELNALDMKPCFSLLIISGFISSLNW